MKDIDFDIYNSYYVSRSKRFSHYNRVYFYSNEDLNSILSNVCCNDKSVLTVLSSGDQAFHFYNRDALSVDVFDINRLTFYYYFLRRWIIQYTDFYYPSDDFSIKFIRDILNIINIDYNNESELAAYKYWCSFVKLYDDNISNRIFYRSKNQDINNIFDLSKIKSRLDDSVNFFNCDISKDVSKFNSKYDIIYISNISDYVYQNIVSFEKYRDNLFKLLNDDGVIISTNVKGYNVCSLEKKVFQEVFSCYEFPEVKLDNYYVSLGKVYKKNR